MNSTKASKRILALDILRGVTIAGMIMVNNPGSWGHIYAPLRHAEWNGLTPTDLVFPFFMFIMGISTYISLKKYNFEFSHAAGMKILKRTIVIFLIGMAIGWFSRFCYYWASAPDDLSFGEKLWASVWTFDRIRILGVMQRLALCYGAASIIALTMKHKHIPYLIAGLLTGYFILLMCGNGFAYNETNILSVVDRAILTPAHMYKHRSRRFVKHHSCHCTCVAGLLCRAADAGWQQVGRPCLISQFAAYHTVSGRCYPYFLRFPAKLRLPHQQENMVSYLRTRHLRTGIQFSGIAYLDY